MTDTDDPDLCHWCEERPAVSDETLTVDGVAAFGETPMCEHCLAIVEGE